MIPYWRFFPASDPAWGRVPVWGYATIVESGADGVAPGDRYFGFWPMSDHVTVEPVGSGESGFVDGAGHRAELPSFYNRYLEAPPQGSASDHDEALAAVLRPLFGTGFLLDEWLAAEDFFGATVAVIASASSKTAMALGYQLRQRDGVEVVGLTSARHAEFVAASGAVDRVVPYDALPSGLGDQPAVFVDMAGSGAVTSMVHEHFGDLLKRSVIVGLTHRDAGSASGLPGPHPELFFAPDHRQRLAELWGARQLAERLAAAQDAFVAGPGRSLAVVNRRGVDEVIATWRDLVGGDVDPSEAIIAAL